MRSTSWAAHLDRQATLNAYLKAKKDGAKELAVRIRIANSLINAGPDGDLSFEFNAIDERHHLLPYGSIESGPDKVTPAED